MEQKNSLKLKELIDLFEHNLKQYKGKHYDEAKARADFIDKFFELIHEMKKKYHNSRTENEKNIFKNQIDILDNQIDQLVYELYGLTKEEIRIVEKEN